MPARGVTSYVWRDGQSPPPRPIQARSGCRLLQERRTPSPEGNGVSSSGDRGGLGDHGEPAVAVRNLASRDAEVLALDGARDRPGTPFTHRYAIHRSDRRQLGRGTGEEQLIGEVQHLAWHQLL